MARVPKLTHQNQSLRPAQQVNNTVRANPEHFGAAIGRGLQNLAAGVESIGVTLEQVEDQRARLEAKNALGEAQDSISDTLHNPETGFLNSRGVNSVNAFEAADKSIKSAVRKATSNLSPAAERYSREQFKALERSTSARIGRHVAGQGRIAESQQSEALISSHGRMAVASAADPGEHIKSLGAGLLEIENMGFETGLPAEVIKEQQIKFESGIRKESAISLAVNDPQTGWEYLQANKTAFTPDDFALARNRIHKLAADHAVSMAKRDPAAVGDAIGYRPPGGGSTVDDIAERIIGAESAGDPNATNDNSSATGLGQFIKSTWLRMVKAHRPDLLVGRTKAEVLALRTNGPLSREITKHYIRHNTEYLSDRGIPASAGNLYLAHFAGEGGAVSVLKSDPDTPVTEILSNDKIVANPFLKKMTASDLIAWAYKEVGSGSVDRSGQDKAESVYDSLPPAMWERVDSATTAAIGEARKKLVNEYDLHITTSPGSVTEQDILSETLLDDGDKARLIRSHRRANEDIAAAGRVNAAILQGERLNPYSNEDRRGLDLAFKQSLEGKTDLEDAQATGERYIEKTGIAPGTYFEAIRGALTSQKLGSLRHALEMGSRALSINPQAFAGQEGAGKVQDDVAIYEDYMRLGFAPDEAAQKVQLARSPENRQKIKVLSDSFDEFAKVEAPNFETWLGDLFDDVDSIGHTEGAKVAIIGEYQRHLREGYIESNGQPEAAKAIAGARMKRTYGVSHIAREGWFSDDRDVLTKWPPERYYPARDGGHEYLYRQVLEDVREITGKSFELGDVILRYGDQTADDIRAGRRPRYQVWYTEKVNGVPLMQVLPGFDFIGDPPTKEEITEERRIKARKAIANRNKLIEIFQPLLLHPAQSPSESTAAPTIQEEQ